MKKIQLLPLVLLLVLGITSCKYEEGPFISVIPKVERVTNTWIVSNAVIDGTQSSSISGFKQITLYKEGGATAIFTIGSSEFAYTGTWVFDAKKETIEIKTVDELTGWSSWERNWTILKLKEDLLKVTWTEPSNGADETYVVEFVPTV